MNGGLRDLGSEWSDIIQHHQFSFIISKACIEVSFFFTG